MLITARSGLTLLLMTAALLGSWKAPSAMAAENEETPDRWVSVSDATLNQLTADGAKADWPGNSAGVTVDPASGDVYMIVSGLGVWKSVDQSRTFDRCDHGSVGGRCETAYSLNFDPAGKRLACFMLDGRGAWTGDCGATWHAFTDVGRNWDYAAVDWSGSDVKNIFAALHESGGQVLFSQDGGTTWIKLFEDPEFERSGGLGIFDANTLVYTQRDRGIQRSTDAGKSWTKVSDIKPVGRVVRVLNGRAYWLGSESLYVSDDQGVTWKTQGGRVEASIGPLLDPANEKRMVVAGVQGIFQTTDGAETWSKVATLPKGADIPKPRTVAAPPMIPPIITIAGGKLSSWPDGSR